jgi:hypothetical protein
MRSHMTRGAPEPSQRLWSHDTRGGTGALPIREADSRAARHVAVLEPTSARRQVSVLRDMWRCVAAHPALYLDLKLIRGGTRSAGYRQWPLGPPRGS